jgi:uncharacterized membrane-anchored protein
LPPSNKAAKGFGLPINPEIAAGLSIPLVIWLVWRGTQHVRRSITPKKP